MGSTLKVDNIVGTSGTSAPITLSGDTATLGSSVTFPAGVVIKKTYYSIGRGTYTNSQFPNDDTIPQRSEGSEIFSQAYTPSTSNCNLFITTYVRLGESSNIINDIQLGLFISDDDDCLILGEDYVIGEGAQIHSANITLMHSMSSWGTTEKTFSLRASGGNRFNHSNISASFQNAKFGSAFKSAFIVEEIAT